jgi:hypothetical protein
MNTINPRDRARGPQPLVGIRAIERMLLRHTVTPTPEVRLVVAMICQAMADCVVGGPLARADAESFMHDWRLDAWADAVGLNPEFVREVATKALYLPAAPQPFAGHLQGADRHAGNTQQHMLKRGLHA